MQVDHLRHASLSLHQQGHWARRHPLEKHKASEKGEEGAPQRWRSELPAAHPPAEAGRETEPLRSHNKDPGQCVQENPGKHKQTKRIEFHGERHKWEEDGQGKMINIFSKFISSYNHMNTNSNKDKPPKKDIFLSKREKLEEIEAVYKESIKNLHH